MNLAFRTFAVASLVVAVTGCESIGEGSTVQSISIQSANGLTTTSPFLLHRCVRDQLVAVATFTDGTRADFSYRVRWQSSDPSVVQVSNNDIPTTVISGGVFADFPSQPYRPGTVIPRAATGTAKITATFVNLSAEMDVDLDTAQLLIAPVLPDVNPQTQPPDLAWVAPDFFLRMGFFLKLPGTGRTVLSPVLNEFGVLNPILYRFVPGDYDGNAGTDDTNGELDVADASVANDFDKYAVPNAATPTVVVSASTGLVTGKAASATTYEVEAVTSLCQDPADRPVFMPSAPVRVAALADPPLEVLFESDFNGPGTIGDGTTATDIFGGTSTLLRVRARLDTDGTLATAEQRHDVSGQTDVGFTFEACAEGDPNCICDGTGASATNCGVRLLGANSNLVLSLTNTVLTTADVFACYTTLDSTHSDDCEEDAAGDAVARMSSPVTLTNVPVDLTEAAAPTIELRATQAEPFPPVTPQRAFDYPGRQFDAYVTANAASGFTFTGGATSATQKATRHMIWLARPEGSTDAFTDIGGFGSDDQFWGRYGSFTWLKDVTTDPTTLDIYVVPTAPYASAIEPTTPLQFTVCPSSDPSPTC
jgi:hypothetical protein